MRRNQWGTLALVLAALTGLNTSAWAGEPTVDSGSGSNVPSTWTQWRGPNRDGRVGPADWPGRLSDDVLQQRWRVPLGPSYSGPVVAESLVFTTETLDQEREVVRALDRQTGKQQWETGWAGAMSVPFFAKSNGDWIRSTPAYDGERLYVAGMRDVLVCLDATSGKTLWRYDFVKELKTPLPDFGFVCSPLVDGAYVFVQAGAAVCKLDKLTGKLIWRMMDDGGGMMGSAFSSPIIREVAGRRQLLVQSRERLAGLDLESGEVLWSEAIPAFRGMNILTPTVYGDTVFTSAYGGKSLLLKLTRAGDSFTARQEWENKSTGYMSSPVVIDGHVYMHLRNQRFTCIDLATGVSRWTSTPFGKYWSLVASGDLILALDERGELLLIRANPERFELVDQRKLSDDPTWAHLAVCDDELFVRELNALTAYSWRDGR